MTARSEIEAVLKTYLDGLYEGDVDKLASAFHPTSALTWSEGGEIRIMPRAAWFDLVRSRKSPQAQGLARHDEILSIDIADDRTALVKLKCAIPPRFFSDYLSFVKVDGRWQVAQKVYTTETR